MVNNEIAKKAAELAELMRRRDDLNNTTGFSSNTHYSICDVIKIASRNNSRFAVYVEEKLDILRTQFDLKYWPTIAECVEELANNAEAASPKASDRLTAVATDAVRPSLADFVKAFFEAINESTSRNYGHFPSDFKVTDNSLASLVNCSLNLNPEDFVDGPYIKRLRQRRNEGKKEKGDRLEIR
ncbi:hypothetical protein ACO0LD_09145 [Undibacterium sp. Ji83W]|uniref:hypothetical protein n=1 Tax=Undibacterium sp. Ji83W TaxID=3413043 RepID=UPI003BF1A841